MQDPVPATMLGLLVFLAGVLQICATGPFSVRLSGGPNPCIGRVEVFHHGKWGTVCDDDWDVQDVAVVCRELDCGEALSAPHGAWFGEGTGPIWLNEVRCQGTELHLHGCHHKGFRRHVCTHEEDASAICSVHRFPPFTAFSPTPTVQEDKTEAVKNTRPASSIPAEGSPALRLVGGPSRCSGRVEVLHQGQWGTVCDDMWGLEDVAVVCRELGCGEALADPGSAFFGKGNDAIWLDDVQCQGGESVLTECLASPWGTHNCRHNEDAGAVCSGVASLSRNLSTDEMLLTEVEKHLTTPATAVTTKRPRPIAPRRSPRPTLPTRDQAQTVTGEASRPTGKSSMDRHSEAIRTGQWQVRLAGGSGSCAGRVEVLHDDSWGTVCDDGWDLSDATVVCRELRCGAPLLSAGNARFGPGTGPIWLDDVNCTGKESSLLHCQSQPWRQHNCNHHEDASVICTGTWKPLSLPKPATNSSTAEPILTTQGPNPADESGLQNTLGATEVPTQDLPPAWEMEFPNPWRPEELFLPSTHEMELEVEEATSPWNIQEITPGQEVLQDIHDTESPSPLKTRSPTLTHGPEPTDPSLESRPLSPTWDLESERETEPTSPVGTAMLRQGLKGEVETKPFIQRDDMSRRPSVIQQAGPSSSSAETQPAFTMWDLESEGGTDPPNPSQMVTFRHGLQTAVETVPSVQWDNVSGESPVTQKAETSSFSAEMQSTAAIWAEENERETEPTGFSGTEVLPDTQLVMETVTQVLWDDTPRVPQVTQEPTNTPTESQPVSERETESAINRRTELFPPSESLETTTEMDIQEATMEMDIQTSIQNMQPVNDREATSSKIPDSKGEEDPKQKEILDEDPQTVRTTAVTEAITFPNASGSWDGTGLSDVNDVLSQSPVLYTMDIDGPPEKELSSEVTEGASGKRRGSVLKGAGSLQRVNQNTGRDYWENIRKFLEPLVAQSDAASTPGQTKALGPSSPSADPAAPPTQLSDSSAGCPVSQEPRKEPQDCCCSADSLGNMVHAMDGLRGELGSLSSAIRQQGSQLEAVAHSLAELVTSVHQLVGVLPTLMQPAPPVSVPCRQNEGDVQNQLPRQ